MCVYQSVRPSEYLTGIRHSKLLIGGSAILLPLSVVLTIDGLTEHRLREWRWGPATPPCCCGAPCWCCCCCALGLCHFTA